MGSFPEAIRLYTQAAQEHPELADVIAGNLRLLRFKQAQLQPPLHTLRNKHQGERAVLIANGPSLNRMDFSLLRQAQPYTIGLNKIYLGLHTFGLPLSYYVAVNRRVIEQAQPHIQALKATKFISRRGEDLIREDANTYLLQTQGVEQRFSHDITQGVHEGWTVTYVALQIAYYLGFQEVIIIGMDHRYTYTGEPNQAQVLDGADPNHFHPDYFGGGQTWDNPDLANSEASYRIARQQFEQDGRRIIDATVDGACTIFEKADYRAIFRSGKLSVSHAPPPAQGATPA